MTDLQFITVYMSPAVAAEFDIAYEWYCSHVRQIDKVDLASIIFRIMLIVFPLIIKNF